MAVRQFNRRARRKRAPAPRSVAATKRPLKRVRGTTTQLLHVPAIDGQAEPLHGRQDAMALLSAIHLVAHAVLSGNISIRWASRSSAPEAGRGGK